MAARTFRARRAARHRSEGPTDAGEKVSRLFSFRDRAPNNAARSDRPPTPAHSWSRHAATCSRDDGRPCPHADDAVLRGASESDIFRGGARSQRHALPKAVMIQALACGEIVRM